MKRIPSSPPLISDIPKDEKRPYWSIMIPVYNCAKFLPEALQSVLAQDLGEEQMQIEVVDDASTDADIEALVKTIGKGRIKYFRQNENVGSLRNFETCINRSRGKLIHILHGDDRIISGFYNKISNLFQKFPEAGAAFSNYSFINEKGERSKDFQLEETKDGILNNWLIRIAEYQKIQYAAKVVRREVYEQLGSFYGVTYGEDWEMWVRIARYYPVAFTPEILAEYRGHLGSLTWEKAASGKTFQDLLVTIDYIQKHVPEKHRKSVMKRSKRHCAHFLVGMAVNLWKTTHNLKGSNVLIKQSLHFCNDLELLIRLSKFYLNVFLFHVLRL